MSTPNNIINFPIRKRVLDLGQNEAKEAKQKLDAELAEALVESKYVNKETEEFMGYTFKYGTIATNNKPTVTVSRVLKTGRVKIVSNYYYATIDRAESFVSNFKENAKDRVEREATRKAEAKAKRDAFKHEIKVGDVLYASWGYDQTNVNYFQVVKTSAKSVWVREISSKMVAEGGCSMSSRVAPCKDSFKNEDVYCRTVRVGNYVSVKDLSLSLTSWDSDHYCSWYH